MQQPSGHKCSEHGFTLIELVVVMTIIGILAALGGIFIVRPIEGFLDLSRRATLVDAAENALRRMQRDIRRALPNSVRIAGGGTCLELLLTDDGGRYRSKLKPDGSGDVLDFIHAADNTMFLAVCPTRRPLAMPW
jgi:MSHA biogenesis protein MshO